jgi:hypothetical protein
VVGARGPCRGLLEVPCQKTGSLTNVISSLFRT